MKKIFTSFIALIFLLHVMPMSAQSSAASGAIKNLFQTLTGSSSSDTTSTASSSASSVLGSLGSIGDVIENLVSSSDVAVDDLVGTWVYSAPAVAFKSDNLLKKAGGAAAATAVEEKLSKYYKIANVQSMKLVIAEDSTFTMAFRRVTLTGDITKDTEGNIFFNYKVAGKINIGSIQTFITKSGNTLNVMYDVSKLVTILQKVGSYTGNSTVKGVTSILEGYDGITAGFKLTKQ